MFQKLRVLVMGLLLIVPFWCLYAGPTTTTLASANAANTPLGYFSGDPLPPKTVYLSFDDGPGEFTDAILDILKAKGIRATFFINSFDRDAPPDQIGKKNNLFPYKKTLLRMIHEGHIIGNHSFSHRDLGGLSSHGVAFQLDTVQQHIDEVLGAESPWLRLIRPPFGSPWFGPWGTKEQKNKVGTVVKTRGIVINWTSPWDTSDSIDWAPGEWYKSKSPRYHPGGTAYQQKEQRMLDRIMKHADGTTSGVILMHDTHCSSRDVLARMIDELQARGYKFGTLDEYCVWRWGPQVFDTFVRPTFPVVPTQPHTAQVPPHS